MNFETDMETCENKRSVQNILLNELIDNFGFWITP